MNAISQRPTYRSTDSIHAHIEAHGHVLKQFLNLAADFYNIDMRPMLFDGVTVTRVGPDPVPDQLREMIDGERTALARLELELYEAHQRDIQRMR